MVFEVARSCGHVEGGRFDLRVEGHGGQYRAYSSRRLTFASTTSLTTAGPPKDAGRSIVAAEQDRPVLVAAGRLARKGFGSDSRYGIAFPATARPSTDIGDGPCAKLEALILELGLSGVVGLPGYVENLVLRRADVFVLSPMWRGCRTSWSGDDVRLHARLHGLPDGPRRCYKMGSSAISSPWVIRPPWPPASSAPWTSRFKGLLDEQSGLSKRRRSKNISKFWVWRNSAHFMGIMI